MDHFFHRDRIAGLLTLGIAALIYVLCRDIPESKVAGDFGSKLFPLIAAGILGVCGTALSLRPCPKNEKPFLEKKQWCRLFGLFALYGTYAAALKYVGFKYSTPVFLFVVLVLLSRAAQRKFNILFAAAYSVALTAGVYWLFQIVLRVRLPKGVLF